MAVATAIAAVGAAASIAGVANARKANKTAESAAKSQEEIANRQMAIAEEQHERWKTRFQPLEDQYVEEAQNFGSIANQNKAAKDAVATVKGGFAGAREQLARAPGINTNSQAYLQEANKINLAEAATSAAAQNAARSDIVNKGRAYATDALSLGKGLSANAASTLSSAGSAYGNIGSNALSRAANTMSGIGSIGKAVGGLYESNKGAFDGMGGTVKNWLTGGVSTDQVMQGGFGTGNAYGNEDLGAYV